MKPAPPMMSAVSITSDPQTTRQKRLNSGCGSAAGKPKFRIGPRRSPSVTAESLSRLMKIPAFRQDLGGSAGGSELLNQLRLGGEQARHPRAGFDLLPVLVDRAADLVG